MGSRAGSQEPLDWGAVRAVQARLRGGEDIRVEHFLGMVGGGGGGDRNRLQRPPNAAGGSPTVSQESGRGQGLSLRAVLVGGSSTDGNGFVSPPSPLSQALAETAENSRRLASQASLDGNASSVGAANPLSLFIEDTVDDDDDDDDDRMGGNDLSGSDTAIVDASQ